MTEQSQSRTKEELDADSDPVCDQLQVTWPFHASADWAGVYSEHEELWNQTLSVSDHLHQE